MNAPVRPGSSAPRWTNAQLLREIERQECERSLLRFVQRLWPVVEPQTDLVLGRVLEAICFHLEAVSRGEITRLLINVPPGSMKSLLTDVFWPAWEWTTRPWLRYVAFSYSSGLTERDNRKFLALVSSREYQAIWGASARGAAQFTLAKQGETLVSNSATGSKLATSVGGVGTGERGDRVICFPYGELVQTEDGPKPIGWVVETRYAGGIQAWDKTKRRFDLRPAERWLKNPGQRLVRLRFLGGGSLTCTEDHKVLAASGDFICAGSCRVGGGLLAAPRGVLIPKPAIALSQGQVEVSPDATTPDPGDGHGAHTVLRPQHDSGIVVPCSDLANDFLCEVSDTVPEMAVPLAVSNVLSPSTVLNVGEGRIGPVVVLMPDLLPRRARAEESCGDHLMGEAVEGPTTDPQRHARIAVVEDRRHDLAAIDPTLGVTPRQATHVAEARYAVQSLCADDLSPVITQIESVELIHDVPEATYCLTVADHHTLLCGTDCNIICSNCDDPHNVKEAESDAVRTSTVEWFANAASNRLNDMKRSAIVIIMQRVHEDDVSGFVLSKSLGYTHLMIPAEFETGRDVENALGWADWREDEGESFWPDRYPLDVLASIKRTQSPFAYAGQYQQRPEPKGGGILQRDWWQPFFGREYPAFAYTVASIDTAYGEKQENDCSALTCWGVYTDHLLIPRALLIYAWQGRVPIHELVQVTAEKCTKLRVDRLLIEGKASGLSLNQEMRRLYASERWGVQLVDPGRQDKVARVHSVAHLFWEGIVQAAWTGQGLDDPEAGPRAWADMVIHQCATFPRGAHDDLVDSTTQALRHLRDLGMLTKAAERQADEEEALRFRKPEPKLYPV